MEIPVDFVIVVVESDATVVDAVDVNAAAARMFVIAGCTTIVLLSFINHLTSRDLFLLIVLKLHIKRQGNISSGVNCSMMMILLLQRCRCKGKGAKVKGAGAGV